jgi:hypothetical protein
MVDVLGGQKEKKDKKMKGGEKHETTQKESYGKSW